MTVSLVPTSRGGSKLVFQGYLYRFQKKVHGDNYRWRCGKSGWWFKCPCLVTTDRKDGETVVLNEGDHSTRCEPNNAAAAAAQVRRDIIDRGVLGAENPLRLVADAVGVLVNDVIATLPNRHSLKKSAVNAKYREEARIRRPRGGPGAGLPESDRIGVPECSDT